MREQINTQRVIVEIIQPTTKIIASIKRSKFIRGKVLSVGSGIDYLRRDDMVTLYNEGTQLNPVTRLVNAESIILQHDQEIHTPKESVQKSGTEVEEI